MHSAPEPTTSSVSLGPVVRVGQVARRPPRTREHGDRTPIAPRLSRTSDLDIGTLMSSKHTSDLDIGTLMSSKHTSDLDIGTLKSSMPHQ